ncbi:MAG: hypothetical protein H8K07_19385 [Nitrospira sp.]|jgi:hypothetical membrane protein|nr:hypothetical protein [Nitrospira sp.]MDI3465672.1 hypothetical protein [Nitrospira sp.]
MEVECGPKPDGKRAYLLGNFMPCWKALLNEELFTISLWALHLGGVYRKPKGDDPLMVSFIEVFLLAAIFGVLYAMLQLARR